MTNYLAHFDRLNYFGGHLASGSCYLQQFGSGDAQSLRHLLEQLDSNDADLETATAAVAGFLSAATLTHSFFDTLMEIETEFDLSAEEIGELAASER